MSIDVIVEVGELDHIVEKFNPYHDSKGRFTTANSATAFTYSPGKSKAHDKAIAREKERQTASAPKTVASKYMDRINGAKSMDDLDSIIEEASNDDSMSNKEYEQLYAAALSRAQGWQPH